MGDRAGARLADQRLAVAQQQRLAVAYDLQPRSIGIGARRVISTVPSPPNARVYRSAITPPT